MNNIILSLSFLLIATVAQAQPTLQYPPAIPATASDQQVMQNQLLFVPANQRSAQQWRQLALVSVALLTSADSPQMAQTELTIGQARHVLPDDALLMAIEGSLYCIQAGSKAIEGMQAMALVNRGFRQLDRAVLKEPDNIGPRLQRAITASRTPVFLGKRVLARQDFNWLINIIPETGQTQELRSMLFYQLGELIASDDPTQAKSLWQRAAALPGGEWSERARKQL
ncbi:Uncharacterised protein [Yersinia intermedia]|uniref:hypothetical protein n=1 Tax=Yersinia intermedia TaxID=631 RepID=UPI0005DB6023|nr:hypothetical protein [Yersinia intermedia]CQJ56219.1 Uncharacterised protein [Yersinia intermedia]